MGEGLAAFRSRDFRVFWTATFIRMIGMWMQRFGQGYLVAHLAIRDGVSDLVPLYLGFVGLAQALPALALTLVGGALADRVDRRRVIFSTELVLAGIAALFAILIATDLITVPMVLVLAALTTAVYAVNSPARQSLFPSLIPREHLVSAVGLNSTAINAAQMLGPVLGGLLYVPLGIGGLFAICALTFMSFIGALSRLEHATPARAAPTHGVFRSIREGLAFVRDEPILRWVFVLALASQFLVRPYIQLMPAFTEQILHVGPVELAWLLGAAGGGAFAGTVLTTALARIERRGRVLTASGVVIAALMTLFVTQRTLAGALPAVAALGICAFLFQGMVMSMLQVRTPDAMRGRVLSLQEMLPFAFMPLGVMTLGSLGTFLGIDVTLAAGGLCLGALALFAALRSDLWGARVHSRHPQRLVIEKSPGADGVVAD